MSNEGFKVQASIKDQDGDMVNFRADSSAELKAEFEGFPYAEYASAKAALRGAGAAAPIVQPAGQQAPAQQQAPQQSGGWGGQQQAAPQQQQQFAPQQQGARLHPEGKTCGCGNVLNYKEVNRRSDGKLFKFWECPQRKGSKDTMHVSEFAN